MEEVRMLVPNPGRVEDAFDQHRHGFELEWLQHVFGGALPHRMHGIPDRPKPSDDDHRRRAQLVLVLLQQRRRGELSCGRVPS